MADVHEAREEYDRQWCAIILDEFPYVPMKQIALSYDTTSIREAENQKRDHDGEIC